MKSLCWIASWSVKLFLAILPMDGYAVEKELVQFIQTLPTEQQQSIARSSSVSTIELEPSFGPIDFAHLRRLLIEDAISRDEVDLCAVLFDHEQAMCKEILGSTAVEAFMESPASCKCAGLFLRTAHYNSNPQQIESVLAALIAECHDSTPTELYLEVISQEGTTFGAALLKSPIMDWPEVQAIVGEKPDLVDVMYALAAEALAAESVLGIASGRRLGRMMQYDEAVRDRIGNAFLNEPNVHEQPIASICVGFQDCEPYQDELVLQLELATEENMLSSRYGWELLNALSHISEGTAEALEALDDYIASRDCWELFIILRYLPHLPCGMEGLCDSLVQKCGETELDALDAFFQRFVECPPGD